MSAFENQSGKINQKTFNEILMPKCGRRRTEVRTGPAFGVDSSVIDLGNGLGLAVSSDPLSLIPSLGLKESAWLSVHLLSNDMATTGFAPMYAQFVLTLPVELSKDSFQKYWDYIHFFCDEIGVAITGGHTGQVAGQNSTMPGGGTMFLTAPLDDIITSDGAEPGDRVVVTKETALTASSILAMSFPETIQKKLGKEVYEQACKNFYRTSSLKDALAASEVLQNSTELKAMHDVTEGGVLGAVSEMASASDCGFIIENKRLPVGKVQLQITELFGIDHRQCVGAGSMIMAIQPGKEIALIKYLESKSIPAVVVGEMTDKEHGFRIIDEGVEKNFDFTGEDPYWRAFYKALEEGWK